MNTTVTTNTITITVNGREITCEKGARLLDVLLQNAVFVPHLCYYERLSPYAGCRTCVVEIEGVRGTPVSCTATVTEGMVVRTESPQIDAIRHGVMEYILCDHPGRCFDCHRLEHCGPGLICLRDQVVTERCLTCAKNRFCELQEVSEHINMRGRNLYYTEKTAWYGERNDREVMRIIRTNPFIELEFDKCIICTRCVRVCDEVRGRGVFTLSYKGPQAKIDTMFGVPLQDTDCEFCGACVDVCPTAAIMDRASKWIGIPDMTVASTCTACAVGCGLKLAVKNGTLFQGFPDFDNPANNGQICALGRYGHEHVRSADRLTTPLIRRDGALVPASWDEAIDLIAARLAEHRGTSFGLVTSARLSNEDHYVAQKLARVVLGSNNIDHGSGLLARDTLRLLGARLGHAAAATNTWDALSEAQVLLLLDSDVTRTHPIAGVEMLEAVRRKNATLIVAATDEPEIVRLAAGAPNSSSIASDPPPPIVLRHRPGSEAYLLAGLLRALSEIAPAAGQAVSPAGALGDLALEVAAAQCGVAAGDLVVAARALANAGSVAILFPAELSWVAGQAAVDAVIDLALVTACLGRPAGGLYALLADGNAHGAFDTGAVPDLLPGHQPLSEPAVQERFRAAWGAAVPTEPGLAAAAMYQAAIEKRLQALYIAGENPVAGPNGPAVRAALEAAAFVVVQDTRLTETAALADVVLPATLPQEKAGTVTSNERRVQVLRPAVAPVGGSRPDWQIFQAIARKLGARGFEWDTSDEVTAEMAGVMPIYAGLNPERFETTAPVCWPIHLDGTGTAPLYGDGFAPGLGRLMPLELRPRALNDSSLVLRPLAPGGVRAALRPESGVVELELAELNASDARRLAVSDGDVVTVSVNGTSVQARARLSERAPAGTVGLSAVFEGTAALFSGAAGLVEVRPAR